MTRFRSTLVLLLSLTVLTACKDDPLGVNSGDPMTEEEIQEVFFAIADAFEALGAAPAASGPARASVSVNESFTGSAPCPMGGAIAANGSASGTVDDETFELDLSYRLRLTPDGCVIDTETTTITLDAAPYIQLDMDFHLSETELVIGGSQSGGISYTAADGRVGSCAFSVQFSGSVDLVAESGSSQVSGEVCGVSASGLTVFELDTGTT
jgi:hypothetical protein